MLPVSNEYRQQLIAGNRNYLIRVDVKLNGSLTTDFTLTNEQIWDNGIVIDQAISSSDSFDIGAAIVGSLKVVINNISGTYSSYDFYGARLTLWLGVDGDLDGSTQRYYRIGFYVVDEPSYNGSLITLNCLDNMTWFDISYSGVSISTTSDTTAQQLVQAICSYVGVSLDSLTFPNYQSVIKKEALKKLKENDINCREVLQYIAQKCCCYCKITTAGKLSLFWYDKSAIIGIDDYDGGTYNTHTTPYSDGVALDGGQWYWDGSRYVWTQGDEADGGTFISAQEGAWLTQNFEMNVSTDNIVVTGVRLRSNLGDEDEHYDELYVNAELERTHERYVLVIENNPLILKSEVANLANNIGNILAYLPIRAFNSRSMSDFSYETGDMVTIVDFRNNIYYSWITGFTFTTNNSEAFSCGAQSVRKRNETRYSVAAKTLAEAQEFAEEKISDYDRAVAELNELGQAAIGYRELLDNSTGSTIMYRYSGTYYTGTNPNNYRFPNSSNVFKITGDGVFISYDHGVTFTQGYDANSGTAILNLIYVRGLNAGWITAGKIDVNRLNIDGIMTAYNTSGTVTISGGKITASSIGGGQLANGAVTGTKIANTTITGGKIATGAITAEKISASAVTTDKISASAITSAKISAGAITSDKLTAGAVTTDKLTAGAVSADKIAAGAVTSNKIAANTITADKMNVTDLKAISATIGAWQIDNNGFTNRDNAWVTPSEISCGKYGGTLVGMRGKGTGDDSGYLEVGTNNGSDCIRVGRDYIRKYDAVGNATPVAWDESDRRLKKNIENLSLSEAINLIQNVRPRKFEMKETSGVRYGFIAQELREILDDNCAIEYGNDEEKVYHAIHYNDFIAPLCMIVNKQQEEIDLLKQELAELKARIK